MVIAVARRRAARTTALRLEAAIHQAEVEVVVEAQQAHSVLLVAVDVQVLAEALAVVADTRQAVAVVAAVVEEADANASLPKQKGM